MISFISTHRNRFECLDIFLHSFELANIAFPYEIVITDLGSDKQIFEVISKYKSLPIVFESVPYFGTFWKTKALNFCVKKSKYNIITMLDIDSIVTESFCRNIYDFVSNNTSFFKLAHRVRFLDNYSNTAKDLVKKNEKIRLNIFFAQNNLKFRLAIERYTENEVVLYGQNIPVGFLNRALGNSHQTIRKEDFMAIGGLSEAFIGHGLEDLDFNLRLFRYLKKGTMQPILENTIFHIAHSYESDWNSERFKVNNREVYRSNKSKRVVAVKMEKDWGIF